jgi:hypothetical membrane protein
MMVSMPGPNRQQFYAVSAAAVWLVAGFGYLTLEGIAAAGFNEHYSYGHDFISDLGEIGSPLAYLMNTAFCMQGTLFLVGAVLVQRAFESPKAAWFLTFAAMNALGNVLIALFHSGPSARAEGTLWIHVTGALLAIAGGNAAILAGSAVLRHAGWPPWYRKISAGLAVLGLLSLMMLVIESKVAAVRILPPATWERCSVYPITGWQIFTAACLFARDRRQIRGRGPAIHG